MFCPKHKIPLKLQRDVKIRELAATCPFCKVEKRAANGDTNARATALARRQHYEHEIAISLFKQTGSQDIDPQHPPHEE
jgi:hypothetical protein